ncbi:sarcosine oxidase subunit gamma [Mesorhizobium sp. M0619]|uniref:sarcosine oxidase subunit gamma n=1 Tax=unclassified Mesorhizobium TaxID=325217 RepID=UPI00333A427F
MANISITSCFEMAVSDCAILQFEGWVSRLAQFEAELSKMLGGALPNKVGDTVSHDALLVIRVGPRRLWLLCDRPLPAFEVDADLGCALALSEGRVRLRLSGGRLRHILERCVAVDWEILGDGKAVQTGLHRVSVLLLRRSAFECDVLVPRSFGKSLAEWIADASETCT